jgi:TonB family protein
MSFGRRGNSALLSLAIHVGAIAILLLLGWHAPRPQVKPIAERSVVRLLDPVKADLGRLGAGGGGNHSLTAPSIVRVPPHHEFHAPLVVAQSTRTPLLMDPAPSLTADIRVDSNLLQFGDPHGVPGPPSSGPGNGGGIGDTDGTGIGHKRGPGAGDGEPGSGMGSRGVLTPPVLLWKVDPDYSDPARTAKVQGIVVLRIEIDQAGQIRDMRVDQSLGLGLDEKAMEAVRRWRFMPGMRNGKAVTTSGLVEVHFRLL